ncbi:MAG: fibronectin type III domain-containing protein [Patescibacteria group bacterium]|nr:fibronectin type III domain-containing protein [Patescibacteria group bacterium]
MAKRKIFFIILPCLFLLPFLAEARIYYSPNLKANEVVTSDTLGVNWYAGKNEKYGVYYKKEGAYDYVFAAATSTPSNLTLPIIYYKSGLEVGTLYSFKVKACAAEYADSGDCFSSESKCLETEECIFSSPLSLTTNPGKPLPDYEKFPTSVNLFWPAVKGATLYQIGYKNEAGDKYNYIETTQKEYTVSGLVSDTAYNFKIQACNSRKADTNNDREYEEGCSGFSRVISLKTPKEQTIAELEGNYERKNLRLEKTLAGYLDYINKLKNLSAATRSDFIGEITNTRKQGALDLLKSERESVKTETKKEVIEAKIADLDKIRKPQLELLNYKLKIFKKCDGYYKKLADLRTKVGTFPEIPETAKDSFIKAGGHIDKAIENYRSNYEEAVLAGKLPVAVANLTGSLAFIKTLYENINRDESYKTAEVIYKTFYSVSEINSKLESLKSYSRFDNKKCLFKVFIGYYPGAGEVYFEDKFREMLDDFENYYRGYVADKKWDSYETAYKDYNHLRGNDRYNKAVIIVNNLKKLNSILVKVDDYYSRINSFSKTSPEVKAKAVNFSVAIKDKLQFGVNPLAKEIVDNPDKATTAKINSYLGHKTFGYFYKGVKLLNDFNIRRENLDKIIAAIGACPAVTGNLGQADSKKILAEGKLREFSVDDLEATKLKYKEFENFYREASNYYKAAIAEAKKCL